MRRNKFNEAYCRTPAELTAELSRHDQDPDEVYASGIENDPGNEHGEWYAEVVEKESGETVCFVEADSRDQVAEVLSAVKVELE
jgi:hypothetical protein